MADSVDTSVQEQPPKLTVDQFAAKIKAKYPSYANIDNQVLAQKIIAKYPQYADTVEAPKQASAPPLSFLSQPQIQLSPVLPENRDAIQQQQDIANQRIADNLKSQQMALDPEHREAFSKAANIVTQPEQVVSDKEGADHYNYMQTPSGKALGVLKYIGSKATKGTAQVAKGASYLADMGVNPLSYATGIGNPQIDKAFDVIDKNTNFGLTKGDQQRMDENPISGAIGSLAEFIPAALGASSTGGATFYLQGLGQGKDAMDQAEKSGVQVNPLVKNAFILGTGAVNGYLMGDLGNSMFKSLPAGLRGDITASITADAIKKASGKELTGDAFKSLLDDGAKEFTDKLARGGIKTLEAYKHAVTNLSALSGANFALKKGVDITNGTPVFNEKLGDLASNLNDVATKQAPFFAIPGAIEGASKLTPYSDYKNTVVESLMKDSSPENVEKVKNDIAQYGQQNGWKPEEIQATVDHTDKIAQIAKTLPKTLPENKVVDAVDLVNNRNGLQEQLNKEQEQRSQLDPAMQEFVSPNEQMLTDKVEQANDKLRDIATGSKTTYSKGTGDEEGQFFKTINGKKEEINESRYNLEKLERTNNQQLNSTDNENESSNGEVRGEQSRQENGQNGSQENDGKGEKGSEENGQEKVVTSGEAPAEPEQSQNDETTSSPQSSSGETTQGSEPTGVRNADVEKERGKVVPREVITKDEVEKEGKRLVDSGEVDPDALAQDIIDNKKPVTAQEQAALLYHKTKLKNRQRAILKDDNPENTVENQIEYARNEDLLAKNQEATEIAGNVTGRALGFRTETMNGDYSRNSVFRRAKLANNGEDLDKGDKEVLEKHTKKIEELENQLADREEEIRKLQDKDTVSKVKRNSEFEEHQAKREITKASLRKEREALVAELHLQARKSLGKLGANKIPLEMLPALTKLARNYVLDGAVSISGVADRIYNDLKNHLEGISKEDISDAIKNGFDDYLDEQNKIRLERSKKRQQTKLKNVREQLETGNYEKRVQKKIAVDNDYLKIRAEINRQQLLINKKIDDIANSQKSIGRKAVDFAVKYGRQSKLASVPVLGKLAATGLTTMGIKGATEGVGKVFSTLLPQITKKSTVEGSVSMQALHEANKYTEGNAVKSIAQAYARAATIGMKDAYDEINIKKGGQSDLSALYGKYTATRLPAEAAELFGHIHSAIKAPIKRFAWEHSYAKRVAKGIENGIDVQDPVIDAKNRLDAYKDAERAIFMGDNFISKGYEASMKTLENANEPYKKNIAAITRILLPFVKVPTNIVLSTGRYSFGAYAGIAKLAQMGASSLAKVAGAEGLAKAIHKGMGELTPEESDLVLRNLKHGSVGAAFGLMAFFNPENFGGYYQLGEHRKKGEVKPGHIKLFGHQIPMWMTEHPVFQTMQVYATFRRVLEAYRHKDDNVSAAALATASGLVEGIPLANEAKQFTDLMGNQPKKAYRFGSQLIKGEIEPAAIQQLATVTDTKNGAPISFNEDNQQKRVPRKNRGFIKYLKQDLASGIPGLRKTVPKK